MLGSPRPFVATFTPVARILRRGARRVAEALPVPALCRLLGALLRGGRAPVLAFAARTDPDLVRAWQPAVANLRHLARHRGARFVAAPEVAGAGPLDRRVESVAA